MTQPVTLHERALLWKISELEAERDRLREAIRRHRDEKWQDNGYRYDDWDSPLYREAGVHPMYSTGAVQE